MEHHQDAEGAHDPARLLKAGQKKKLAGAVRRVMHAIAVQTAVMGEVIGQGCYWADRGVEAAGVLEIFAGAAKITEAYVKHGERVCEPRDLLFGHDLTSKEDLQAVLVDVQRHRPELVFMAPECRHWSQLTRVNFIGEERQALLRQLRNAEEPMIRLVDRCMREQLACGRHGIVENPASSQIWEHPIMAKLRQHPSVYEVVYDACAFNARDSTGKFFIRKRTRLLVTHPIIAQRLAKRCDGLHDHLPLEGAETRKAAEYPQEFAECVRKAVKEAVSSRPSVHMVGIGEAEEEDEPAEPEAGGEKGDEPGIGEDRLGAKAITFGEAGKKAGNAALASLRRLHQNLGHPSNDDLVRLLRGQNASDQIIRAAKQLRCTTCAQSAKAGIARPAAVPRARHFNADIGIDILYIEDVLGNRYYAVSIVELSTTYHVVTLVRSLVPRNVAEVIMDLWVCWAGPPETVHMDNGTEFASTVRDAFDHMGTRIRVSAPQSPWQVGRTERQGGWFKEMLRRTVKHTSATGWDEMRWTCACVCAAKNSLRRRCGFSPNQWVFGTEPRIPGDLTDQGHQTGVLSAIDGDEEVHKRFRVRMAARAAFVEMQDDSTVRRALLRRARVRRGPYQVGDRVFFYRDQQGNRPKSRSSDLSHKQPGVWKGPAVVIGTEGPTTWVSHAGRCIACSHEHIRLATEEEMWDIGEDEIIVRDLAGLQEALNKSEVPFEPAQDGEHGDGAETPAKYRKWGNKRLLEELRSRGLPTRKIPKEDMISMLEVDDQRRQVDDPEPGADPREQGEEQRVVRRRITGKSKKRAHEQPEGDMSEEEAEEQFWVSGRMQKKALEKEIPWSKIPPEQQGEFRSAAEKQWAEWVRYGAVKVLSEEESAQVREQVARERILPARFLYRNKNVGKHDEHGDELPLKAKARMGVGGHRDPDLSSGDLRTDAPTVHRLSLVLMANLAKSRGWTMRSADITAAFRQGAPENRGLYAEQLREGLPGLVPGQLLSLEKGVFGLATAPRLWWQKLAEELTSQVYVLSDGREAVFKQSRLDPCVFVLRQDGTGPAEAVLVTHVDDLLVGYSDAARGIMKRLDDIFPIDSWEELPLTYVGCDFFEDGDGELWINQKTYIEGRLEEFRLPRGRLQGAPEASREETMDNMSAVGGLSWLSSRTRADLSCVTSMSQKRQGHPQVRDLQLTAWAIKEAKNTASAGLKVQGLDLEDACLVVFHDAGWANADGSARDPDDLPTDEQIQQHQVYSQIGQVIFLASREVLRSGRGRANLLDWRSHACHRVCRSTFAAETMACAEGLEMAIAIRGYWLEMLYGDVNLRKIDAKELPILCITDCKSLFDAIHKEGVPKLPTEKRLVLDLASIKEMLQQEATSTEKGSVGYSLPLRWVPTSFQLADVMTKPMSGASLRSAIQRGCIEVRQQDVDMGTKNG